MNTLEKIDFLDQLKEIKWEDLIVENYLGIPDRFQVKLPAELEFAKIDFMKRIKVPKTKVNEWNFIFDDVRTNFNRIHFERGISPIIRGLGVGFKMYRALIEKLKWGSTEPNATLEALRVWQKLMLDDTLYHIKTPKGMMVICKSLNEGKISELVEDYYVYYDLTDTPILTNLPQNLIPKLQYSNEHLITDFNSFIENIKK
jgi:hypothetical protein